MFRGPAHAAKVPERDDLEEVGGKESRPACGYQSGQVGLTVPQRRGNAIPRMPVSRSPSR